ncbi:MAG: hypothetical protein ACJAU5_000578 [Maricaulis maris]
MRVGQEADSSAAAFHRRERCSYQEFDRSAGLFQPGILGQFVCCRSAGGQRQQRYAYSERAGQGPRTAKVWPGWR